MADKADAVVIGLGPGGEYVASRLAEAGFDVVGIEGRLLGGECPYWGCIPSKMMVRAAHLLAEARRIPGIAGESEVTPDWGPVARRIRDEATDDWNDRVAVERFEAKGGRFVRGEGTIAAPGRVAVGDTEIEVGRAIVVATGTRPAIPPIPGLADVSYWTNREAIEAKELPASMTVLGGGAIGVELAQAFSRFGVEVSVVEALDRLVPLEEAEAGELLSRVLMAEGVSVRTGARASRVGSHGGEIAVELANGEPLRSEKLLVATGRRADVGGVGLGTVGVPGDARSAPVDEYLRVAPGVWAVGDITGVGAFTHVAVYQAGIAAADILGEKPTPAQYRGLPRVTFTDPEIGSAGLTEDQARSRGMDIGVGSTQVPSSIRGWIHKAGNEGFIKVVEDRARGVLVGASSVGPVGGEVLGLLALAIHAEVPVDVMGNMIYAYPTFHRAVEEALAALRSG